MVAIRPFRAVRPQRQYVKDVASYPYDVIDSREARKLTRYNSKSFLRIVKSEVDSPDDNLTPEEVYERARANLYTFLEEGILFQDDKEKLYIYRQKMGEHVQFGVVGCVDVAEYDSGVIKRHELTRKDKEADRTRHIDKVNAQTGPLYLTYRASKVIDKMVYDIVAGVPEYDFRADDGITHSVWIVEKDDDIAKIRQGFSALDSLYIADGHHRTAAAAAVSRIRREGGGDKALTGEHSKIMAVIFPHDQLMIMDYNRVVRDLGGFAEDQFIARVKDIFILSEDFKKRSPEHCGEFGMYLGGRWYGLKTKEENVAGKSPVQALDVSILQDSLLDPVLGIADPRTDDRLIFVGGIRGMDELEKLVDSGEYAVAFSLHPTTIEQLMTIADRGEIMPPKSTWFEPKLRSGIFVHLLD